MISHQQEQSRVGTRSQDGACKLEPTKEQSSDVDDETRHAIRIRWLGAAHGRERAATHKCHIKQKKYMKKS